MDTTLSPSPSQPRWALFAALAGFAWSLFGAFQFASQTFADEAGLVAAGMTPGQAALYASLPVWMDVVFAIGTIGGSLGCLLLLFSRKLAVPVLGTSLIGYLALYAGDILYGVFASFGAPQVIILSFVVAVAAALLWLARWQARRGNLA